LLQDIVQSALKCVRRQNAKKEKKKAGKHCVEGIFPRALNECCKFHIAFIHRDALREVPSKSRRPSRTTMIRLVSSSGVAVLAALGARFASSSCLLVAERRLLLIRSNVEFAPPIARPLPRTNRNDSSRSGGGTSDSHSNDNNDDCLLY
jgi:hypothetical protein